MNQTVNLMAGAANYSNNMNEERKHHHPYSGINTAYFGARKFLKRSSDMAISK